MNNQDQNEKLHSMRHTLTHIMMQAIRRLYGDAKPGVGPAIEDGFYHDFDLEKSLSEENFKEIEKEMHKIVKENLALEMYVLPIDEGIKKLEEMGYDLTLELAKELKEKGESEISFYKQGEFENMCKGPHVESTGKVGFFKISKISGAYWRGDEKNKMLQRIYGYAFETKKELKEYLERIEEAKKRDHRVLGKQLDLFTFSDLVGKGLPLWTPKGSIIRREIERFIVDEEIKRGYEHVYSPELAKVDLYRTSGHYPFYKEDMYPPMKVDDDELILRPMTCPHHFMLYSDRKRSYRELPLRIAELAKLYRYEQSGELTGLMRVRSFCLADSHIICRPEQVKKEIIDVIDLIEYVAKTLGLNKGEDFFFRLSLGERGDCDKFYKDDEKWDQSEQILREVLEELKAPFYEGEGEAAFYGPKIDVQMKNVLGKEETAFTVQYDFCMPERFNLTYINEKGEEDRPVVIHRSSVGALERTIAFLIEFYAGALPLWLSPVQLKIIPVSDNHLEYASELENQFKSKNIRVSIDTNHETVGKKIRKAVQEKNPYILVVGDKEIESKILNVRKRGSQDTVTYGIDEFLELLVTEIADKK